MFHDKRHFLFDLDGTLVDSNRAHECAFRETLQPQFPAIAAALNYDTIKGMATHDALRQLGLGEAPQLEALVNAKQIAYRARILAGDVVLFPGVVELLQYLRQAEKDIYLVTGSSPASARMILERNGILEYFDGLVGAGATVNNKPHPDIFLHTVARYRLSIPATVVIEDSANGVAAAQGASLDVAVIDPHHLFTLPYRFASIEALLQAVRHD